MWRRGGNISLFDVPQNIFLSSRKKKYTRCQKDDHVAIKQTTPKKNIDFYSRNRTAGEIATSVKDTLGQQWPQNRKF